LFARLLAAAKPVQHIRRNMMNSGNNFLNYIIKIHINKESDYRR